MFGLILKAVGSAMIVFGAYLVSRGKCENLKERVRLLDGLLSGFVSLEEHICGMLIPAVEAINLSARDAGAAEDIFLAASCTEGGIRECFSEAMKKANPSDSDAVLRYVSSICSSDEAERRTAFSLIRSRLSEQRKEASEACSKLCRLYTSTGVLGGALVVILLF